ncbi:MAG: aminotransferase class V-fold PLP-dependent enzyme [Candidatus Bathyarchaeia archaeon]
MKESQVSTVDLLLGEIRREFPYVETDGNGKPRVFFENAAGSLVLKRAAEAESKARLSCSANTGGPSWESKKNEETILEGRKSVRDFLNAPSEHCIVSGESASSMLFNLSYALSREMSGDENIILTDYDHYANISPWQELERRRVVKEVRFTRYNPKDGMLDTSHLASLIDKKTRVISVTGVANALGSKTPLTEVSKLAKEAGAYFVVDAVHTVAHVPIDVERIGCDFLVFSAYKLFSRRGSFMFGRQDLLEKLRPYKVEPAPNDPPEKWEMGTRDQSLFASITAVMDYLNWLGSKTEHEVKDKITAYSDKQRLLKAALYWIEEYEKVLSGMMLNGTETVAGMNSMKDLEVYGMRDSARLNLRVPTFSFNIVGADPHEVAEYMWKKHSVALLAENNGGFYSRALRTYGKSVAVRASPVHFNSTREVGHFLSGLSDALKHFNAG